MVSNDRSESFSLNQIAKTSQSFDFFQLVRVLKLLDHESELIQFVSDPSLSFAKNEVDKISRLFYFEKYLKN